MDEIVIDDKKYISSKRAAKETGYAKDYVGQLCREGRVAARLVGRSWYVLESAIQDHRFGSETQEEAKKPKKTEAKESAHDLDSTWESPRYEAATADILPSINRLRSADTSALNTTADNETSDNAGAEVAHLQNTWQSWLAKNKESTSQTENSDERSVLTPVTPYDESNSEPQAIESDILPPEEHLNVTSNDEDVQIKIHSTYDLPPEDLLPRKGREEKTVKRAELAMPESPASFGKGAYALIVSVKYVSILVAVIISTYAVISSGYFDKLIASHSRVSKFFGITSYTKPI